MLTKPLSIIYQQPWELVRLLMKQQPSCWKVLVDERSANVIPIYEKRERSCGSTGLLAQPQYLEGHGKDHFECQHSAHAGQQGDQAQPAQVLWKACSPWPTWSLYVTRWRPQWMTERLWISSAWTSVKPLAPFPTAFSWKNCLLVACRSTLFTASKIAGMSESREGLWMESHPAGTH